MRQRATILCVDDEPRNLSLLEAVLTPRGYRAVLVQDGETALIKLHSEPIDLVLLDVMMPGMDGFEVCRRIKEDDALRAIPVVMITAYAAKENRIRGIEVGAEEFLAKPFDRAEVLARVAMLLKVKGLNDQLTTAYQQINSLISYGQQLTTRFDPLHYDVMAGISSVVKQLVAASAQTMDNPQLVLVRLQAGGRDCLFYCRLDTVCTLVPGTVPGCLCLALKKIVGESGRLGPWRRGGVCRRHGRAGSGAGQSGLSPERDHYPLRLELRTAGQPF
jgi:DNA-binding response OmpR family regulator